MGWALPRSVPADAGQVPLGVYVHVPWCRARCAYCDFNTYLPGRIAGVGPEDMASRAERELALLREHLTGGLGPASTVYFGGGTPTVLPAAELGRIVRAVDRVFGIEPGAEITVEANPETLSRSVVAELRAVGFTRLSIGMQSAVAHVLETLGRGHDLGDAISAVAWARVEGFENVSLDLIYGAPGETAADWLTSLRAAVDSDVHHVSAYALKIEDGTGLGAARRTGRVQDPDPDVLADRYEIAEAVLDDAGLRWYEISNWARPGAECRHNLGYWRSSNWLGIGPGAHSHIAGTRWWNVKHPARAAAMLAEGALPIESGEIPDHGGRELERTMLGLRLREGLRVDNEWMSRAASLADDGLLELGPLSDRRAVLTLRGRLLGDLVTHALIPPS